MAKFELKKIKTIKSEKGEIKKLSVSIGKQNKISEIYTTTVKAFSENGWRLHKEAKITSNLRNEASSSCSKSSTALTIPTANTATKIQCKSFAVVLYVGRSFISQLISKGRQHNTTFYH